MLFGRARTAATSEKRGVIIEAVKRDVVQAK